MDWDTIRQFALDEKLTTHDKQVGHALHDLDPVFRKFSRGPKVASLLKSLGYKKPIPAQSMYICKQPHVGGALYAMLCLL